MDPPLDPHHGGGLGADYCEDNMATTEPLGSLILDNDESSIISHEIATQLLETVVETSTSEYNTVPARICTSTSPINLNPLVLLQNRMQNRSVDREEQTSFKELYITNTNHVFSRNERSKMELFDNVLPLFVLNSERPKPVEAETQSSTDEPNTTQPLLSNNVRKEPPTLFSQATAKLKSLNMSYLRDTQYIRAPNSTTCAPPTYSFVLNQMNARRPRLMGTFIPSPSFVVQTPPPNYSTAFDIYLDTRTQPSRRVYHYGFTPIPIVCPECGFVGMTAIKTKITMCTHLCAVLLCLFSCWLCVPLPYILSSCKEVYHYCQSCRHYMGMYNPNNPENASHPAQTSENTTRNN